MSNILGGIISKEISNSKRQLEIDITRGLAVFFMVLVHFSSTFLDEAYNNTLFAKVIDFMGCVPAAPVFMFLMGVGFIYTKNSDPQSLFKRGLFIFFGGYILNIVRGLIPLLIGNKLGYYDLPQSDVIGYGYLFEVDIFQFAGLAMIVVSFFKGVKLSDVTYPFIAVFVSILSPYMWKMTTDNPNFDVVLAPVFGGKSYAYHPLFSWLFYPLMGAFFGWLLIRTKRKNWFYIIASLFSAITAAITFLFFYTTGYDFGIVTGNIYNYFHHGIFSNIIFCSGIICWLALWHFMTPIVPRFIKNRLFFWSKATSPMYVVHWCILNWCSFLVFDTFDIKQSILGMILLLLISDIVSDLYIKIKDRLSECEDVDIPVIISSES